MVQTTPTFLTLPFELRLQIYEVLLDRRVAYQREFYLSIASVCRQIRAEVLPVVFQDARYFKSLSHLSQWTSKAPPHLLKHVQNISLHVFMESLSSMTTVRPTSPIPTNHAKPFTAEWWEIQYQEQFDAPEPSVAQPFSFRKAAKSKLSKANPFPRKTKIVTSPIASTWNALTAIPELKKLWISLNDQSGAPVPRYDIEQQLVLDMTAAACPKIQEFTGFSNLLPLNYLRNFHDIRLLRFSGYSKSTPQETSDILRSLKHLDTIIIYRYPEYYDRDQAIITSELPRYLSFTPDVLERVQVLKRFEISHMTPRVPSQHVTIPILRALRAHKKSLRDLSIHSSYPVGEEYLEELLSFIHSSNLSTLSLQLDVPKKMVDLLSSDAVFPRNTCNRKRKFTDLNQPSASGKLLTVHVRASL